LALPAAALAAATAEDLRSVPDPLRPDPAPVAIGGPSQLALSTEPAFELLPGGELHGHDRSLELHPKGLLGVGWDGNPLTGPQADGDGYLRLVGGLDTRALAGDRSRFELSTEAETRRYADTSGRGQPSYAARGSWTVRDDAWWWRLSGTALREDTPLASTALAVSRDDVRLRLAAGAEGRRAGWWFAVSGVSTDYRETVAGFDPDEADVRGASAQLGSYLVGWSRSEVGVVLGAAGSWRPRARISNDGWGVDARLRWRHQPGDRTWLTVEAGASRWTWEDVTADDPANDDRTVLQPLLALRGEWRPEERSHLLASAETLLEEGATANASRIFAITGEGRLRLADRTAAFALALWERRADSGAQPGAERELRHTASFRAGIYHELRDGWAGRLQAGWEDTEARVGVSYTRPVASLEIALAF
jgi:hypothetical protein